MDIYYVFKTFKWQHGTYAKYFRVKMIADM